MADTLKLELGGREHTATRARLGQYLKLQGVVERLDLAVEARDTGAIANALFDYIVTAVPDIEREPLNSVPWFQIIIAQQALAALNTIPGATRYAILKRIEDRKRRSIPWDYVGRSAVVWIHMIARAYGWSKAEIENLWPEDAIGFIQEIMVDEQMEKEFFHSLSSVAYRYDKSTKKSRFQPLPRPLFMVQGTGQIRRIKLVRALVPMGNVIYPEGVDDGYKPANN